MQHTLRALISTTVAFAVAGLPLASRGLSEAQRVRDLWVHPRGETYDAARHYRAPDGELYYKAENDILGLGDMVVEGEGSRVTVEIGPDLLAVLESSNGSLLPVLLWDEDGDGVVDRSMRGRVDGTTGVFDSPRLDDLDLRSIYWQLGIRYVAGDDGDGTLDGRYLASVDSSEARVAYRDRELPPVGLMGGLVILKHREGVPFDFEKFVANPALFVEDFDELSRAEDADDWTVDPATREGRLQTHFDEEDLFIVRAVGGMDLDVAWGDMALEEFMAEYLAVEPDADGCYSSLDSQLTMRDGSRVEVPNRVFYCPEDDVVLFDAPDGYQIYLSALYDAGVYESTEAGTSVGDNFRLYVRQLNPRSAPNRATGTIGGNVMAGFADARADLGDAARHAFTGTTPKNIHTGQDRYRPSLLTAAPLALYSLARLRPVEAVENVVYGVQSGVDAVADVVSATNNAVINPVVQSTVGVTTSPDSADRVAVFLSALTVAAAKNLPVGERSMDALSPGSAWYHNRGYHPPYYTRTDTQLNIDRVMTIVDLAAINAIHNHNEDSGGGGGNGDNGGGGNGGNGNPPPPAEPPGKPPHMKPPHMKPPHMKPPKPPHMKPPHAHKPKLPKFHPGKRTCCSPVGKGVVHTTRRSEHALHVLSGKFCSHPTLDGYLPTKFGR